MAAGSAVVWMRSWSGPVFTTSAPVVPAARSSAAFSISLELVHAPSASTVAAARTATSGARRGRAVTVVGSPREGRAGARRRRAARRACKDPGAPHASHARRGPPRRGRSDPALPGPDSKHAGQEGLRPFVPGGVEDLLGRPGLDDAALVHEHHPVGGP